MDNKANHSVFIELVHTPKTYKHHKGNLYITTGYIYDATNDIIMICYKEIKDDSTSIYCRSLDDFHDGRVNKQGRSERKFEEVLTKK